MPRVRPENSKSKVKRNESEAADLAGDSVALFDDRTARLARGGEPQGDGGQVLRQDRSRVRLELAQCVLPDCSVHENAAALAHRHAGGQVQRVKVLTLEAGTEDRCNHFIITIVAQFTLETTRGISRRLRPGKVGSAMMLWIHSGR